MTQRTQITLDREQHARARARAAELGISLAEYIRTLVHHDLNDERATHDASAIIGLGDSGGSDVARHKQEYLGEAVDARHRRPERP
jgi:hypothetical protein